MMEEFDDVPPCAPAIVLQGAHVPPCADIPQITIQCDTTNGVYN